MTNRITADAAANVFPYNWPTIMDEGVRLKFNRVLNFVGGGVTVTASGTTGITTVTVADTAGTTTLDFGSFPGGSTASVAVTGQTGIGAASVIEAWISPAATSDHSIDEHMFETLRVFARDLVAGTGFTIYGINDSHLGDTRIYGKWNVGWRWQ